MVEIRGEWLTILLELVIALHEGRDQGIFELRCVFDETAGGELVEIAREAVEHLVGEDGGAVTELVTQEQAEDVLVRRSTIRCIKILIEQLREQMREFLERLEKPARVLSGGEHEHIVAVNGARRGLAEQENKIILLAHNAIKAGADVADRFAL